MLPPCSTFSRKRFKLRFEGGSILQQALSNYQTEAIASKRDHVIFLSTVFCFWFSTYIYIPVFGLYLENIGFTYALIGVILGSYGVTQIILRFPLGVLSDRLVGIRKQLLIAGFYFALLSGLLLIFSESFAAVFIARLLAGITAAMWVMATVLYSQYFTAQHASKAMSRIQFITVFAQFFSMMVSGYLVLHFGWKFPFWIAVLTSVIGILLAYQIKDVPLSRPSSQPINVTSHIQKTFKVRGLKEITFLSLSAHAILFITIFGFSPMYASQLSQSTHAITILVCAFFIPHALATWFLMFYKVRLLEQKRFLLVSFLFTAILLAFVPFTNSLMALSLIHAGFGLALGVIFPLLLSMVIQVSTSELKNSAMGFYQSFYAVGILIGPLLAGEIAEVVHISFIFYLCALLAFLAVVVVIFTRIKAQEA
jgi:MFS family permease